MLTIKFWFGTNGEIKSSPHLLTMITGFNVIGEILSLTSSLCHMLSDHFPFTISKQICNPRANVILFIQGDYSGSISTTIGQMTFHIFGRYMTDISHF